MFAMQRLFSSENCTGEAVSSYVPTEHVHCPHKEYYTPDKLDLERLVKKLLRDHASHFQNEMQARGAIKEYKRMLHVIQQFPDAPAVPSKLVDLVWHEHILDTQQYRFDSQRMFGKYLHHAPTFGDDDAEETIAEKQDMVKQQHTMLMKYVEMFGEQPDSEMWPQSTPWGAGRLPDCCKADCAKVNCVSCAGCNAVYCGLMSEEKPAQGSHVLPEYFAGYSPYISSFNASLTDTPTSYKCQFSPMTGMTFYWTIAGDYFYAKQSMSTSVAETWHSIGFTDFPPYDMSYADYIISFFGSGFGTNNYTGIRDLYKYDFGNHYPCWDVLHQCSLNGTKGTQDMEDRVVSRKNGFSVSTWSRKLVTGDYKDSPITSSDKRVMFAYGMDDQFTYHDTRYVTCTVNFFSGDHGSCRGAHNDD